MKTREKTSGSSSNHGSSSLSSSLIGGGDLSSSLLGGVNTFGGGVLDAGEMPSLGDLKKSLLDEYLSLPDDRSRQLARRIFRTSWNYICQVRHNQAATALTYYWLIPRAVLRPFNLEPCDLGFLSRFWMMTGQGRYTINLGGGDIYEWERPIIKWLEEQGYVVRSKRDPKRPYMANLRRRMYFTITPAGKLWFNKLFHKFQEAIFAFHETMKKAPVT